jgi:hypothetical protein
METEAPWNLTDTNFNLFLDRHEYKFIRESSDAGTQRSGSSFETSLYPPSERAVLNSGYVQFHTAAHETRVTHCEQQDEGPKVKPRELHFVQLFVCWERSLFKINNPTGYIHGKIFSSAVLCFILDKGFSRSRWTRGLRRGVCGHSLVGNAGSNPAGDMDVCLLLLLCVVR